MLRLCRSIVVLSISMLLTVSMQAFSAQEEAANPLRLSYINGQVSFWRNGAPDWVEARINTPLASGDALYVGRDADLELQTEGRAFIRADDETQLTLVNQTPDFLQISIPSGRMSFDIRTLPTPGYSIELDTPNAVFTIDRPGYYRVDVDGDVRFITRRGGRATVLPAGGEAMSILPSEEVVVYGSDVAQVATYVAPEPDGWDRWNYDRTNSLIDAVSERYLPAGIAGASDLDHYGNWRVMDAYGPVWVPDDVPAGWAPYSSGRWIWDPYYQWTWVDDAPWGWAPFHYGRWIHVGGYWMWAPGAVVVRRPVYAPALVVFYGVTPRSSISISIGSGGLCWVALGWGEPVVPWWGRSGFIGRPSWDGWGGPRVINNVVVQQTTVTNITNITYVNVSVPNAVVATSADRFGRSRIQAADRPQIQKNALVQVQGALPVKPDAVSLVADAPKSLRPPEQIVSKPVVAIRPAREAKLPWRAGTGNPVTPQRVVPAPKSVDGDLRRPQFGTQTGVERARPPLPPRYEQRQQAAPGPKSTMTVIPTIKDAPIPSARQRDIKAAPLAPERQEALKATPGAKPERQMTPRTAPLASERQEPFKAAPVAKPERQETTRTIPGRQEASKPAPVAKPERHETPQPPRPARVSPAETPAVTTPSPVRESAPPSAMPQQTRERPPVPRAETTVPQAEQARDRVERAGREREALPGKPANRVYRGRGQDKGEESGPRGPQPDKPAR